jgi:hypothetical protein
VLEPRRRWLKLMVDGVVLTQRVAIRAGHSRNAQVGESLWGGGQRRTCGRGPAAVCGSASVAEGGLGHAKPVCIRCDQLGEPSHCWMRKGCAGTPFPLVRRTAARAWRLSLRGQLPETSSRDCSHLEGVTFLESAKEQTPHCAGGGEH